MRDVQWKIFRLSNSSQKQKPENVVLTRSGFNYADRFTNPKQDEILMQNLFSNITFHWIAQ